MWNMNLNEYTQGKGENVTSRKVNQSKRIDWEQHVHSVDCLTMSFGCRGLLQLKTCFRFIFLKFIFLILLFLHSSSNYAHKWVHMKSSENAHELRWGTHLSCNGNGSNRHQWINRFKDEQIKWVNSKDEKRRDESKNRNKDSCLPLIHRCAIIKLI